MFRRHQPDLESNVWYKFYILFANFYFFLDLVNVFEVFLPQLLRYPNPADPLNGEAAALLIREPKVYEQKVKGT